MNKEMSQEEVEAALAELEQKLERLRITYEQYFAGIEKREPAMQRQTVARIVRDLAEESIRNTALKYRFAQANQKFHTYGSYWNRVLRMIEDGRYTRKSFQRSEAPASDVPIAASRRKKKHPRTGPITNPDLAAPQGAPQVPASPPPNPAEQRAALQNLFRQYRVKHQSTSPDAPLLTYEQWTARIKERLTGAPGKTVAQLKVVVKNGKVDVGF